VSTHPTWCRQGHHCSAERGGEHRSDPLAVTAGPHRLVLTVVQPVGRVPAAEVRIRVRLAGSDAEQGRRVLALVQHLASVVKEVSQ